MSRFLEERAAASRLRAVASRRRGSGDLAERLRSVGESKRLSLDPRFDLIAEIKLRSPAEGRLADPSDDWVTALTRRARAYTTGGAAALSVLTEPDEFGGSLEHLEVVAAAVAVPVMRKDFITDEIQVLEARAYGASGVLLIARMLPGDQLEGLMRYALELGLFVLLEAFDEPDLRRITQLLAGVERPPGAQVLIGLNSRDLTTLAVDTSRLEALAGAFPDEVPAVAESGMDGPRDIEKVAALGYRMALVGSALMRTDDPEELIREMTMAGRRVA